MEYSDTGPSYIPLGTAFRTASYEKNENRMGFTQVKKNERKTLFDVTPVKYYMACWVNGIYAFLSISCQELNPDCIVDGKNLYKIKVVRRYYELFIHFQNEAVCQWGLSGIVKLCQELKRDMCEWKQPHSDFYQDKQPCVTSSTVWLHHHQQSIRKHWGQKVHITEGKS